MKEILLKLNESQNKKINELAKKFGLDAQENDDNFEKVINATIQVAHALYYNENFKKQIISEWNKILEKNEEGYYTYNDGEYRVIVQFENDIVQIETDEDDDEDPDNSNILHIYTFQTEWFHKVFGLEKKHLLLKEIWENLKFKDIYNILATSSLSPMKYENKKIKKDEFVF